MKKKLKLNPETLRVLSESDAQLVVGASHATCEENPCEDTNTTAGATCRDTCGQTCGTTYYACGYTMDPCTSHCSQVIDCTAGDCTVVC